MRLDRFLVHRRHSNVLDVSACFDGWGCCSFGDSWRSNDDFGVFSQRPNRPLCPIQRKSTFRKNYHRNSDRTLPWPTAMLLPPWSDSVTRTAIADQCISFSCYHSEEDATHSRAASLSTGLLLVLSLGPETNTQRPLLPWADAQSFQLLRFCRAQARSGCKWLVQNSRLKWLSLQTKSQTAGVWSAEVSVRLWNANEDGSGERVPLEVLWTSVSFRI